MFSSFDETSAKNSTYSSFVESFQRFKDNLLKDNLENAQRSPLLEEGRTLASSVKEVGEICSTNTRLAVNADIQESKLSNWVECKSIDSNSPRASHNQRRTASLPPAWPVSPHTANTSGEFALLRKSSLTESASRFTTSLFRSLPNESGGIFNAPPWRLKENHSSQRLQSYDLDCRPGPLGLELETDWYGKQAVVKGFKRINNDTEDGPAKKSGLVRVGDVLTAINGQSCLELDYTSKLEKLRELSKHEKDYTLHFKSLEAVGDLAIYNRDWDILQAKSVIHHYKASFYMPIPSNDDGIVQCYIMRHRGECLTSFHLHREDTNEFVLAASCLPDCSGEFLFHTLQDSCRREWKDLPQNEDSSVYLGKMTPNFLGDEFIVFDHTHKRLRELGFIVYTRNVLGQMPNAFKCVLSPIALQAQSLNEKNDQANCAVTLMTALNILEDSQKESISQRYKRLECRKSASFSDRIRNVTSQNFENAIEEAVRKMERIWAKDDASDQGCELMQVDNRSVGWQSSQASMNYSAVEIAAYDTDLVEAETLQPEWSEKLLAWTLSFEGRVKMPSKKNFVLVSTAENDAVVSKDIGNLGSDDTTEKEEKKPMVLRFGKVSKNRFALDFRAPFSPVMALAVASTAFAHKRIVT